MSRPIVVIPACTKLIEGHAFDAVGRKYSAAIAEVAECQPLLVPLGASMADIGAVLEVADAILLSGSVSNVAPEHYGKEAPIRPEAADPARDALTLPLIRAAIERKTPLFAICRGFQELNVALGGSLYQAVHAVDGHKDHRARLDLPLDEMYGSDTTRSWSTRCTGRASRGSPLGCSPRPSPRMVWSRPCADLTTRRSVWAYSGTPSGD
jgi:putative glutamine amidotransferase